MLSSKLKFFQEKCSFSLDLKSTIDIIERMSLGSSLKQDGPMKINILLLKNWPFLVAHAKCSKV